VFFFGIFHCTYTYNNCAWLLNCCKSLHIFHSSTCGNSAWYICTIWHVALCVCVQNCALAGHTTHNLHCLYGIWIETTLHSTFSIPSLSAPKKEQLCMSLSPIPSNCCQIYQSLTKADVDLCKCITKLWAKKSWITSWLELLGNNGRRKHQAIGHFTSADVYRGTARK
jgi:hypothetical protein